MIDNLFFPFTQPTWNVPTAPTGVTFSNGRLTMELPGVTPDRCRVTVLDGERALRVEYHKRGTDFKQDFRVSDEIDLERVEAILENGLLEVSLPKKEFRGRSITLSPKKNELLEGKVS